MDGRPADQFFAAEQEGPGVAALRPEGGAAGGESACISLRGADPGGGQGSGLLHRLITDQGFLAW